MGGVGPHARGGGWKSLAALLGSAFALHLVSLTPARVLPLCRQSASGVSQLTLALVTLSTWLQLLNLVILHYDQIVVCVAAGASGVEQCDHSLTTLAYISTSLLAAAPLLPLALAYTPPGSERDSGIKILIVLCIFLVATGAPVLVGLNLYGSCAPLAAYATVLGVSCALAYIVMYLPQIAVSLQTQSAGSLSYGFLILHIVLGVASAIQKAEGTHERIVTWAPPLVANVMQALLIGLNLYFDTRDANAAASEDGEASPLAGGAAQKGVAYGTTAGGDQREESGGSSPQKDAEKADTEATPKPRPALFSRDWWERYL